MGQVAAIEAALRRSGEAIGRPLAGWQREDKADETFFLHNDQPLICVVMDEEALGALTEDEAENSRAGTPSSTRASCHRSTLDT